MRRSTIVVFGLLLAMLWLPASAPATSMKSTAPEKMLPRSDARKMRVCDEKAVRENIPMDQKTAFVKKCMAEMK